MATYFTSDFADWATDWTARWRGTTTGWGVTGGDVTFGVGNASDWNGYTWNDLDSDADRDDIELLALISTPSSFAVAHYALSVRGAGADETATNYTVRISSSTLRTYQCNGTDTPTQVATTNKTISTSTDYWVRFRVNGSTIQARIWADGGSEPGTWDLSTTDTTHATVGHAGLSVYAVIDSGWVCKQLGVGTNGDTAPSSATTTAVKDMIGRGFIPFAR